MQVQENDQRAEHKHHQQHGADEQEQEATVLGEGRQAVFGNAGEHQAHNAERGEIDDPTNHLRHAIGNIGKERLGAFIGNTLHGKTEQASPHQNADVVAVDHGLNRIGHNIGQQRLHNLAQALRHHIGVSGIAQRYGLREHARRQHRHDGGQERGEQIQEKHRAETAVKLGIALSQSACHQHKHQNRSDGLQCAYEQGAEFADPRHMRNNQCQCGTRDKTDDNADNQ